MTRPRAIVIGSGFGGAVSACRLAQAGFAVQVLERGRRYDAEGAHGFPRKVGDDWLWGTSRGLFEIMLISQMQVVQSAGYGGGSLIYANVHLRLPEEAFVGFPAGYSRAALDPYYDLVAHMLEIRPITDSQLGVPPKARALRAAAEGLGRGAQFFHPPLAVHFSPEPGLRENRHGVAQSACTHCGECSIGCPVRAKNTLDLNYLALAERAGAEMLTEHEVLRIEPLGAEGSPLYRVHYRDLRGEEEPRFLEAEHVFVCAGAIHSTALLLRSREALPRLSARIGERYSGNGDMLAFAYETREPFEPAAGPTITGALLHDDQGADGLGWFLLQEGGFPRQLWPLVAVSKPVMSWFTGRSSEEGVPGAEAAAPTREEIDEAYRRAAESVKRPEADPSLETVPFLADDAEVARTAVFLGMGRDLANGRIELSSSGALRLVWDTPSNRPLYDRQERLGRDVARQLGGIHATTPFWRFFKTPTTVHNLGGCPMGDDVSQGVTSEIGEVFNYPNLFVMDGALLPGATGVNPAHTIAAVAERNLERIIRRVTGDPRWAPPERAATRPFIDPLSLVRVLPGGTRPLTSG